MLQNLTYQFLRQPWFGAIDPYPFIVLILIVKTSAPKLCKSCCNAAEKTLFLTIAWLKGRTICIVPFSFSDCGGVILKHTILPFQAGHAAQRNLIALYSPYQGCVVTPMRSASTLATLEHVPRMRIARQHGKSASFVGTIAGTDPGLFRGWQAVRLWEPFRH